MVKVKKSSGRLEAFKKSKIIAGCRKAGATAVQATQVAKEVSMDAGRMAVVPATKLSNLVVASLRKANRTAADAFVKFRGRKLKRKRSK